MKGDRCAGFNSLSVVICAEPTLCRKCLPYSGQYNLGATLDSGQAFRWRRDGETWTGIVGDRWVRLQPSEADLRAQTAGDPGNWDWLKTYLQSDLDLEHVLASLPDHPYLAKALRHHRGLRILRQDPWECLATFILSSTKQITQIKVIVERLCTAYGEVVQTPHGEPEARAFPQPDVLAALQEKDLRALGMGFRAPYLLQAAERVDSGECLPAETREWPLNRARAHLMELPGVGRKIADCVLLFALGFQEAFPVDVWVMRTLQTHWFPEKKVSLKDLVEFSESRFGPWGGYAQQYLFHFARTQHADQARNDAA